MLLYRIVGNYTDAEPLLLQVLDLDHRPPVRRDRTSSSASPPYRPRRYSP